MVFLFFSGLLVILEFVVDDKDPTRMIFQKQENLANIDDGILKEID
jgi:hypothetical protein